MPTTEQSRRSLHGLFGSSHFITSKSLVQKLAGKPGVVKAVAALSVRLGFSGEHVAFQVLCVIPFSPASIKDGIEIRCFKRKFILLSTYSSVVWKMAIFIKRYFVFVE